MRGLERALIAGLVLLSQQAVATPYSHFSELFVFGDSLSDVGNLFLASNGTVPDPSYYYNGRFQNGKSYTEVLYEEIGLSGVLTPSLLGGNNFAVGGARGSYYIGDLDSNGLPPHLDESNLPTPFSLLGQVSAYSERANDVADQDALYLVWSGANDVTDVLLLGQINESSATGLLNKAISDIVTALTDLYAIGARHFLVPNLPDLGKTPEILELDTLLPGTSQQVTAVTMALNAAIDVSVTALADAEVFRFDTFGLLNTIIADPAAYGITNTTDACLQNFFVAPPASGSVSMCDAASEYMFWDQIHPTAAIHEILGLRMAAALVPSPSTLLLMSVGLFWLRPRRRMPRPVG